ncbi:SWIM zinc finger family protein [Streptosporangium sp. NPDC004379]|uniref:SWIM zinc finger family protein n=1 Tax=Streptosporangium sp. NPDC004379 TaxID=3366189 RepID=UPI003679989C
MTERWNRDQVLALAPDASSQKAAQGVSSPGRWSGAGATAGALWGECRGSGSKPYLACVDLSEPAYRCSCPSRKFPCKHALGLLLLWSAGGVPDAAGPADWAAEWLDRRRDRAARAAVRASAPADGDGTEAHGDAAEGGDEAAAGGGAAETGGQAAGGRADGGATAGGGTGRAGGAAATAGQGGPADARRAAQRERRVAAGLAELERWLADQVRQGLAASRRHDQWDDLAKRLVDAQAPAVAGAVSRLGAVLSGDDWPARLLGEYALLHLLAVSHRRLTSAAAPAALGGALLRTVRERVGFPVAKEEVLAGETVRDRWDVLGRRDTEQDRIIARRVWLRGRSTGRAALVLSFAPVGQALDASLVTGTIVDADLAFYPGSCPLRALVAARHDPAPHLSAGPPPGSTVDGALDEVARAIAADPWTDSWPLVLEAAVPAGSTLRALAGPGGALALHPSCGTPWRLIAASGGHPLTVAAEWTPEGLRPLTAWDEEGQVIVL